MIQSFHVMLCLIPHIFIFPGVIVAGGPGTGKSSCIQVLVDALSAMVPAVSRQQSRNSVSSITAISHKLQRINPLVVDDLHLMFGQVNPNQEFVDGVFTNIWRKANRVRVSLVFLSLKLNFIFVGILSYLYDYMKI